MHKLAYAEFPKMADDCQNLLNIFQRKFSEQLNAMDKQKYEIKYSISKLKVLMSQKCFFDIW